MKSGSALFSMTTMALLSFWITLPTAAVAQDYHPLDIGLHWEYTSVIEGDMTMTIEGEFDLFGTLTRIRQQVEATQTYENYWTADGSGNLYLHGAKNYTHDFEAAYQPPIQFVAAPLFLDKTWVTEDVQFFYLDGTPWGGEGTDFPMRVHTEGDVTVPAGDFYAYGVGFDFGPGTTFQSGDGEFDVFGRRVDPNDSRGDGATEWYSEGIGLVIQSPWVDEERGFRLVSFDGPVPVQLTSWGQIRLQFR